MRELIRNRLISVLREQKSLVYSPYISLMYEGIPQGIFYFDINASADNDNMPQIEQLLKEILHQLKQQEVDNEELNTLKRSFLIAKREALNEESPSAWRTALVGLLKTVKPSATSITTNNVSTASLPPCSAKHSVAIWIPRIISFYI